MIKLSENGEHDQLLRPDEAAAFLTSAGFPTAKATLAKLRCVGSGPTFHRFGRLIIYMPSDLYLWASQKISAPLSNTSQY
jgi:hypothetical protein